MNHFGPTKSEMKFRLAVSVFGMLLIAFAVALRGLPTETQSIQLLALAFAFLTGSLFMSASKLKNFKDE